MALSKIVSTQPSVDTMLKDPQSPRYAVRRTHRTYTSQFKAELVAACQQPGASIATIALQHGMNTNVLHRWLKEYGQGHHRLLSGDCSSEVCPTPAPATPAFLALEFSAVSPSCATAAPTHAASATPAPRADIRIELQRQGACATVHWPVSAAAECARMLREWLR
ncbi:transposase [Aquabacterium sp.]|jgi:transposase-like protein|uniref:IS66-like element accessory protein TnpA n=1 Tax=Aquabacterium sp. TaxID=1872578 RepID=UPI0026096488|nr:transposase [Aquabacterium sp.]MDD2978327.1 transposase [Aquabacterium sp.]